jgi:hypothetical protein
MHLYTVPTFPYDSLSETLWFPNPDRASRSRGSGQ